MKNKIIILIMSLMLSACGKEEVYNVIETPKLEDGVTRLVDEVNANRQMTGKPKLSPGLSCSLYLNLSNTLTAFPTSLPSSSLNYTHVGEINQPDSSVSLGLNILPASVRTLYTQWFAVRCSGVILIEEPNIYSFELRSDDAGLLYINNSLVVDNNGLHAPITKAGYRQLGRGEHTIRVDYLQGPGGQQALVLMRNGKVVPSNILWR